MLARIAGVDLPNDKRIEIALTYIFGIGRTTARKILRATGVNPDIRVKKLTDEDIRRAAPGHRERVQGRGRAAQRDGDEHQAPDGHRRLSRPAPPAGSAGARPAHQDQRAHPQGSEEDRGRRPQEGSRGQARRRAAGRVERRAAATDLTGGACGEDAGSGSGAEGGKKTKKTRAEGGHQRRRPRAGDLQQHHRDHHRHGRQRDLVGERREGRLQGLAQEHAVRGAGGRRGRGARGRSTRA